MNSWAIWVCLLTVSTSVSFAQSEVAGATLNGAVTDPSGAAVVAARIIATNDDTGLTRETSTSEAGLFNFVRLPVGRYTLNIESSGFKPVRRAGIALNVGALATLDITLEVGAASETVTVTGETPLVETTRSQTSTTVNEKAVRDLPINGRNFRLRLCLAATTATASTGFKLREHRSRPTPALPVTAPITRTT